MIVRRACAAAMVALATAGALPAVASAAAATEHRIMSSRLALPLITGETVPELVLAQRTIEREWGLSEDSVWVERDLPAWRSEAIAAMLSAVVPGSGQAYAGEKRRGLWFALAEAAAWTARILLQKSGEDVRDDAAAFAGSPGDSAATWSYARWLAANSSGSTDLLDLYAADREAFYDVIASDSRYLSGWAGDANASRSQFAVLRATSDRRLRGARFSEQLLWVNHVVATIDALRAARVHNRTLLPGAVGISIRGSWHRGPGFRAVLERRF